MLCRECQQMIAQLYSLIDAADEAIEAMPQEEGVEPTEEAMDAHMDTMLELAWFVPENQDRIGITHAQPEPAVKQVLH
jgi:hypothetical protein